MKKLKIYLNNFNIISILSIFLSLFIIKFLFKTSNYFINAEYSILNMLNLFNINLMTLFLKLILIFHIFFILYSFFTKKFYSIDISKKTVSIYFFLFFKSIGLMIINTVVIIYLANKSKIPTDDFIFIFLMNTIYLLAVIIQIICLFSIVFFMFFSFKNFLEQIKFKYIEGTSIDKYFDNSLLNKRNIYQGRDTIDGFLYKNIMFNIKDNIAVVNNEEFNLNVIVEYLELNNKLFNGLNEEDFKIIRLMNY